MPAVAYLTAPRTAAYAAADVATAASVDPRPPIATAADTASPLMALPMLEKPRTAAPAPAAKPITRAREALNRPTATMTESTVFSKLPSFETDVSTASPMPSTALRTDFRASTAPFRG